MLVPSAGGGGVNLVCPLLFGRGSLWCSQPDLNVLAGTPSNPDPQAGVCCLSVPFLAWSKGDLQPKVHLGRRDTAFWRCIPRESPKSIQDHPAISKYIYIYMYVYVLTWNFARGKSSNSSDPGRFHGSQAPLAEWVEPTSGDSYSFSIRMQPVTKKPRVALVGGNHRTRLSGSSQKEAI